MSQSDVMEYLDQNKGIFYTAREIYDIFKDKMNRSNVHRVMSRIIKRSGYEAKLLTEGVKTKRMVLCYRAKV